LRNLLLSLCLLSPVIAAAPRQGVLAKQSPASPSTAFYYGAGLPADALSQFDHVVVQADQVEATSLELLRRRGSTVFAYISLSEVSRHQAQALDDRWRLGHNPDWETLIMDATQAGWRRHVIEKLVQPLWNRGYRAFFLDNLDSYQRTVRSLPARNAQVHGLAQIIADMHAHFPGVKILLNRGFELLPQVAPISVGIVAESLFRGWDPVKKIYVEVKETERSWLLDKLRTARDLYRLPVTAIDYVPPNQPELRRKTAQRIAALGMTPWVTDHALAGLGIGGSASARSR
jgi:polysaccharide biosynthesis protein PelA